MQKYRKKPVIVEAIKYNGFNENEIIDFTANLAKYQVAIGSSSDGMGGKETYSKLTILTLEGEMLVSKNDWVIKGVNGEFYPCKPDIFGKTYEEFESNNVI